MAHAIELLNGLRASRQPASRLADRQQAAARGLGLGLALVLASSVVPAGAATPASGSSAPAASSGAPGTAPGPLRALRTAVGCLISPDRVADIGSPVVGIVASLPVDVGDVVRAGQTLVSLRADVEGANVQAAQARSSIDAEVLAAEASLQLARQRLERSQQLQAEGFVSSQATDQARAEHQVAQQKLQQARGQLRVSAGELGVARAQLGQRRVQAGFDGVIVERFVNVGERVEDKPMLRLARLDPLRVELVVPAQRYGSLAVKDQISVQPDLPGAAPVTASVTHVDPLIDAASNTFRVRLKLPNPGHVLPGGARCKVDLPMAADSSTAAGRPATGSRPAAHMLRLAAPDGAVQPVTLPAAPVPAKPALPMAEGQPPRSPAPRGLVLKLTL